MGRRSGLGHPRELAAAGLIVLADKGYTGAGDAIVAHNTRFTVVATDLRGFGASGAPPSTRDHAPYSMRELARDQAEVMNALGYQEFAVAGHDRGARCACRMALDLPATVARLAVLDIVPTGKAFGRADREFSLGSTSGSAEPGALGGN